MKIVYVGNNAAVDVPALGITNAEKGKPVEVSAEKAKTLLLSADWKENTTNTKSKEADKE